MDHRICIPGFYRKQTSGCLAGGSYKGLYDSLDPEHLDLVFLNCLHIQIYTDTR